MSVVSDVIVVFGREPIVGRVKTRLAVDLGESAAAKVYSVMLQQTLEQSTACGVRVVLYLADRASPSWNPPCSVDIAVQRGSGLGARLEDAVGRQFSAGARRVVVIGSDCPELKVHHLQGAFDRLSETPVVLGPAADGGYWLLGQRAPGADVFRNIPWSARDTLQATRCRLQELGLIWSELQTLEDVDTAEDLQRLVLSGRAKALSAFVRGD